MAGSGQGSRPFVLCVCGLISQLFILVQMLDWTQNQLMTFWGKSELGILRRLQCRFPRSLVCPSSWDLLPVLAQRRGHGAPVYWVLVFMAGGGVGSLPWLELPWGREPADIRQGTVVTALWPRRDSLTRCCVVSVLSPSFLVRGERDSILALPPRACGFITGGGGVWHLPPGRIALELNSCE